MILKLWSSECRDNRVALGLCEERDALLTYDRLIWIPNNDQLWLKLLYDHHDALVAWHPGPAKTLELLSQNYYWPQQQQYVNRYIDCCDTCKRIKPVKHPPFGLLRPLQLLEWPWDLISMDCIMALPLVEGWNALWVIVDQFTKMAHFVTCADTLGPRDLADGFSAHVVQAQGLPNSISSDHGLLFTSTFWTWIMEAMGTTRNLSTSFHPETDRQMEHTNVILEQYLWSYC